MTDRIDPAALPLPTTLGGPELPFRDAIDDYVSREGITRAEAFRRVAAATGNSPNGVALRYYSHGDRIWRLAMPS